MGNSGTDIFALELQGTCQHANLPSTHDVAKSQIAPNTAPGSDITVHGTTSIYAFL